MLHYVLGKAPAEFGLLPDAQGWLPTKELLKALHEEEGWRGVRQGALNQAAQRLAPELLEIDGKSIRLRQGAPPRPRPAEPPGQLFIALRPRAYPLARKKGLLARPEAPLLLAASQNWALRLGRRRSPDPVLVTVQARKAAGQGVEFLQHGEELYLCQWVPPDCLMGPKVAERPPAKKTAAQPEAKAALPPADALPGSFNLTPEELEKPHKRKGLRKEVGWKRERRRQRRRKG